MKSCYFQLFMAKLKGKIQFNISIFLFQIHKVSSAELKLPLRNIEQRQLRIMIN